MANLNIGASLATVASLTNLPVDKGTVYATLSAPSNLSLAEAMYQGQKLNLIVNPTANMTIPMPTTTGWYTTFGDTLALIANVRTSIDILCIGSGQYLISATQDEEFLKYAGYDYVDLGLPSGLLWATCNVGASQPHEYGKYFQWGATEGYYSGTTEALNHSTWSTCPFNNGSSDFNDSYFSSISGTVCPKGTLALQYDAARANMGGDWRMPTSADTFELYQYTTSGWTSVSGVQGVKFTSNRNLYKSIFIPAAGIYHSGMFRLADSHGYGWSSSLLTPSIRYDAYGMYFNALRVNPQCHERYYAISVRGVIAP